MSSVWPLVDGGALTRKSGFWKTPVWGKLVTVLTCGQWVNISNTLKHFVFELEMVSGSSRTNCKCVGAKTKKRLPVSGLALFSAQNLPFWGKISTVRAGGQGVYISNKSKLFVFELEMVSGSSRTICKCLRAKTKKRLPVSGLALFLHTAKILVKIPEK